MNEIDIRRQKVLAAVSVDWETAEDIAERAGVSLQSAAKQLDSLAHEGKVSRDHDTWVDERYRRRARWLYRVATDIDWAAIPAWMTGCSR